MLEELHASGRPELYVLYGRRRVGKTELLQRFCEDAPENERFFADGADGHHQFDLEGYVAARLAAAGVTRVACLGLDTYRLEDRYFSYRRATHREEPDYGRQISLIGLAAR